MLNSTVQTKIMLAVAMSFFVIGSQEAFADAWWGEGARKPEWVIAHGGTIIRYKIEDISGDSDEYKAVMYDKDGEYVEKEFGKKAMFDDAKNGVYVIKAYRGGTGQPRTHKGGKKIAEITVTAHPGETINLLFNYKKKSVKMTSDYVFKKAAKPVVKPESKPAPQSNPIHQEISDTKIDDVQAAPPTATDSTDYSRGDEDVKTDQKLNENQGSVLGSETMIQGENSTFFQKIWSALIEKISLKSSKLFG